MPRALPKGWFTGEGEGQAAQYQGGPVVTSR